MNFSLPINAKGQQLEGIVVFEPTVFEDDRGFFMESWSEKRVNEILGNNVHFVQDNHSLSCFGVLRGLHYQITPHAQGKLVRCIAGEIYDVAVDIRKNSKTFLQWVGVHLSAHNKKQLWIPNGFAHGFLSITKRVEVVYKVTDYWVKESERSILWNDPNINILWPKINGNLLISNKDKSAKLINEIEENELF